MNLTIPFPRAKTDDGFKVPWWTRGETNAFFGLAFNILVNVLTLTGLLIFVVKVPADAVLGKVLPALGIALIVGNVYYTILARRLARRERHRQRDARQIVVRRVPAQERGQGGVGRRSGQP